MRDTCPHRAAPFSEGCIIKNTVECPYHGWRFDVDSGICKTIPSLTRIKSLKIRKNFSSDLHNKRARQFNMGLLSK